MPQDENPNEQIRSEMAVAVLERAEAFDMKRKDMEKLARTYFLGGSKLAELVGDQELSSYLKDAYLILVERPGNIFKWAGIEPPAKEEPEEEKKAA